MIRILHVLGGLERGGAETMVMNLYRAIDRTQIQFDFIIHTEEHQAYYSEICDLGGKIYSFPKYNGKNYFAVKKNWNSFFVNHPEYKILHSHIRSYASLYIPVAKKHGVKTIIHSHSTSNGKGFLSIV
ncbi:MAG: glycosyltransferase, partial [Lutispora sp.]